MTAAVLIHVIEGVAYCARSMGGGLAGFSDQSPLCSFIISPEIPARGMDGLEGGQATIHPLHQHDHLAASLVRILS